MSNLEIVSIENAISIFADVLCYLMDNFLEIVLAANLVPRDKDYKTIF